eukprot:2190122-Pyramimonas_sp.AAC.1
MPRGGDVRRPEEHGLVPARLVSFACDLKFPPHLLYLGLMIHVAPRMLESSGFCSELISSGIGVLPGCMQSMSWVKDCWFQVEVGEGRADLGASTAAGKRRSVSIIRKRRRIAAMKARKVRYLTKLVKKAAKLYKPGVLAVGTWASS